MSKSIRSAVRNAICRARQLRRNQSGSTAVSFALLISSLTVILGLSVDIVSLQRSTEIARNAADTAALAALSEDLKTPNQRRVAARRVFEANLTAGHRAKIDEFQLVYSSRGGSQSATVRYAIHQPLAFAGVLGRDDILFRGEVQAARAVQDFVDVWFWLDGSASMGIAADEQGRDRLVQISRADAVNPNCAFACHFPERMTPSDDARFATKLERAHAYGVELRFDLMKTHVERLIDQMADDEASRSFRFGIARIDQFFDQVLSPTGDSDLAKQTARSFAFSDGRDGTFLDNGIDEGRFVVGRQGSGMSEDDRRKIVVMVTDGFRWHRGNPMTGQIHGLGCEAMKTAGIEIAVIHLRYVELDHPAYREHAAPYVHLTGPALERCASPGMYFSADSRVEIDRAFADVRKSIRGALRLTK